MQTHAYAIDFKKEGDADFLKLTHTSSAKLCLILYIFPKQFKDQ
jgi:hypothetical protein